MHNIACIKLGRTEEREKNVLVILSVSPKHFKNNLSLNL